MLALLLAAALDASAPASPPAGKYWYAESVNGKRVNVAAVELQHTGSTFQLNEEIKPEDESGTMPFIETRTSVNPASMDLVTYEQSTAVGCGEMNYTLAIHNGKAKAGKTYVALSGVSHYVVDDSFAFPFLLPSQLQLWNGGPYGVVDPVKGTGYATSMDANAAIPVKPASVPIDDRYASIRSHDGLHTSIWYDPATLVVDQMSTGGDVWTRLMQPPADA